MEAHAYPLLHVPRLGDGAEVARGHHHAAEERAVLLARPVGPRAVREQREEAPAQAEVHGQVGRDDALLEQTHHARVLLVRQPLQDLRTCQHAAPPL